MSNASLHRTLFGAAAVLLAACSDGPAPVAPADGPSLARIAGAADPGAVFTSTNAAGINAVLVYARDPDGRLGAPVTVPTGGAGLGSGLGSQGSVVLTGNRRFLLVVNAGSNDVSVFRVKPQGLESTDLEPSGGTRPVSIAVAGDLVYVLNAGSPSNVSGFRLTNAGDLQPIAASGRTLSAAVAGPAQAAFDPKGRVLLVTEKATNQLTTFDVQRDGLLGTRRSTTSSTPTPFGFAFDHQGRAIVSEAAGGAAGASVVSSYALDGGVIGTITASAATTQSAACWVLLARGDRLAFTTNTASGTVSAFDISSDGSVALRHAVAANTGAGSGPIDMTLSGNGRFVIVLAPGGGAVRPYEIETDGTLRGLGPITGVPATAYGLAAY